MIADVVLVVLVLWLALNALLALWLTIVRVWR